MVLATNKKYVYRLLQSLYYPRLCAQDKKNNKINKRCGPPTSNQSEQGGGVLVYLKRSYKEGAVIAWIFNTKIAD